MRDESPSLMRDAINRLAVVSRWASWPCALLIGMWTAWFVQPLTVETLLERTAALQFSYADVYSELHEQPFAYCDTYYPQRTEALNTVNARAKELMASSPMAVLTMARDYDAALSAHYEEDCRRPWRPYQNSARVQAVFAQDYPLYYVVSKLRLTEVRLALVQIVAGWLGIVSMALLSVYFWRSPLAPVASLIVTSVLVRGSIVQVWTTALPGAGRLLSVRHQFMLPALTLLLIIAMVQPALRRAARPIAGWITVGLAIAYGAHAMLYYVVDPPVARLFAMVGLLYVGLVGLAYRRWQVVGGAVAAAAVQLALDAVFRAPSHEIYAAVSHADHLASEAYRNVMIYMGLFERPTRYGLFYMDEIFAWIIDQDPVLSHVAPFLAVQQSYAYTGSVMVWHTILTQPLTLIDAMFRRLLVQIFYPTLWHDWTLRFDWVYTGTLGAIVALNAWAWTRRPLFVALTPITLCLLVNQFAANTLMTMVHTHSRWSIVGVMMMYAVAPLYLFAGVRLVSSITWRWPDWRRHASPSAMRRQPLRTAAVALALVASAWFVWLSVTTLREEHEFVHTWMTIHQPPPTGLNIDGLLGTLDAMRAKSGDKHGELAMWTASILKMYEGRTPTLTPERRKKMVERRHQLYRTALALAPDNEHYLFAARFLEIDNWESYLLQGLQRFPDSVHAPGAAASLKYFGRNLSPEVRAALDPQYERLTGRFLASADERVPGFRSVPTAQTLAGSVKAQRATDRDGRPGFLLTMSPGAVAVFPDEPTLETPSMRLFSYVDVQSGATEAALSIKGEGQNRRLTPANPITKASELATGRYQVFEGLAGEKETAFALWLKAGPEGATVEVRDYYPILDYPKHYYRSGLMDRVRRRAARAAGAGSVPRQ